MQTRARGGGAKTSRQGLSMAELLLDPQSYFARTHAQLQIAIASFRGHPVLPNTQTFQICCWLDMLEIQRRNAAAQHWAMFSSSRLRTFLSSRVRTIRANNSWEAGACCVSAWLQCNELIESLAALQCKRSEVGPGMLYISSLRVGLGSKNHMPPDLPHFFYNIRGQAHLLKGVFPNLLAKSGKPSAWMMVDTVFQV